LKNTIYILGISAFYHDSAAAIIADGNIIAAAQEERFTRKKHDSSFPANAVKYCLEEARVSVDELESVVFYDKPFLKFERLLETYYGFAPKGIRSFIMAMPVWLKEKMFLKSLIHKSLKEAGDFNKKKLNLQFPEHHLSHAAGAYYPSPFDEAAILTIDGVGEWTTASICKGEKEKITILKDMKFPHSLGLLYSAFTYFLGFRVNSGEYKLMGLAPYGNHDSEEVKKYEGIIREKLVRIYEDGSIWLDQSYFNYATGLTMVSDRKWATLFGIKKRNPEDELDQAHCDLALAIQNVTEEVVLKLAKEAKKLTGSKNICLSGGVALNCVANGRLQEEGIFENVYIQPASGDAGGSLGAALAAWHIYLQKPRTVVEPDSMKGSYLGPSFSDEETIKALRKHHPVFKKIVNFDSLAVECAGYLAEGKVIGWMQGRMEFGPRALGSRSILGDARNPEMQKKLNMKIKYRESFRPFAPSVLEEDAQKFFKMTSTSPYMLLVHPVEDDRLKVKPDNYNQLPLREKLYHLRSDIPAVTHIDNSARIQTVSKETNPRYWTLIDTFGKKTGYPILVNTSFNVRGEPIVCNPEDAYLCFMRTEMDYLVIGNFLFDKKEQPEWTEDKKWQEEFVLD